jgi:histidinol-phosphate/aromatic aminotransferase/cobyric acid decarboxylase-like protein
MPTDSGITLTLADERDRQEIYRLRHRVYARELHQHPENDARALSDALDLVNAYVVAKRANVIVGFVSITPPNPRGYSIDKYFVRADTPLEYDDGLYEVRLLTVVDHHRHSGLAALLMYAALRYAESQGARTIVGIGRREILSLYTRAGLRPHGLQARSGAVTYELMSAAVTDLRRRADVFDSLVRRAGRDATWQLEGGEAQDGCFHGGAFWEAIGDSFDTLERRADVINADVLDAWFDPAPGVVAALESTLRFALKTSPPAAGSGMQRRIARARGVPAQNILVGAGSSDLIFAALRGWVTASSRVLILDPMYGEYAHVLERVIGAAVDRLPLSRTGGYELRPDVLAGWLEREYDWVFIVNPNSPTGRHVPRVELEQVLAAAPAATRFWIDETYVDFVDERESLETFAAASRSVVVCKSMSKAYALSGVRAAYLCGPADLIAEVRRWCAPWSVSLPGQIAACAALDSPGYYRERWAETSALRGELFSALDALGWDVVPGCANFLLCHLPESWPDAATLIASLRRDGLFLRDAGPMGTTLGDRAIRVAVKDAATNRRMVDVLRAAATARLLVSA